MKLRASNLKKHDYCQHILRSLFFIGRTVGPFSMQTQTLFIEPFDGSFTPCQYNMHYVGCEVNIVDGMVDGLCLD